VANDDWVPEDVDLSSPNVARIYDYYLGGAHNFAIDREFAKKAIAVMPDVGALSWLNRLFLRRAVRYCVDQGVRQFLDIGSGIPTVGHTHEIAQAAAPDARVVYVDNEAVAVAHSEMILQDNPNATVVRADARSPEEILTAAPTRALLDFDQPIAILMLALVHFIPDDQNPVELISRYRNAVASGSHIIVSSVTADRHPAEMEGFAALYRNGSTPLIPRSAAEFGALLTGWDLVEPGVSPLAEWHPSEEEPPPPGGGSGHADELGYGAVARKP
jgi:hypothetical protein